MAENQAYANSSQNQGIKAAILIVAVVIILLFFFPWVSSPIIAQFAGIASYISGQTVSSEFSIPSLAFALFDLMGYSSSSSQSSSLSGAIAMITVIGVSLACIWVWALLDLAISGIAVLSSNKELAFLKRAAILCIVASGSTIVVCLFADLLVKGSMSRASSGLSSYVGITYLSPTVWAWLALALSIVELVLLQVASNNQRVISTISKVSNAAIAVTETSTSSKTFDALYAAYGKAVFEAVKADPALPKIAPKEWSDISAQIEAIEEKKREEERKALAAKILAEERAAARAVEEAKRHAEQQGQFRTIKCPVCAREIDATSKFCPNCGYKRTVTATPVVTRKEEINVCHSCGASLKPGASFCGKCGSRVI